MLISQSYFGVVRVTVVQQCITEMVTQRLKVGHTEMVTFLLAHGGTTKCGLEKKKQHTNMKKGRSDIITSRCN